MRATSRRVLKPACNVCNELLLLVLYALVCDDPAPVWLYDCVVVESRWRGFGTLLTKASSTFI